MSTTITLPATVHPAVPLPDDSPREYRPGLVDRRRPGRPASVSPALIPLMRKPTQAARIRVALYDAPGFILPDAPRWQANGVTLRGATFAVTACAAMAATMVRLMLMLWG